MDMDFISIGNCNAEGEHISWKGGGWQAETIMDNMETVTQALADADLGSMVENVNALAADSQSVVSEAMEKLDTIDIDTLNKAITDLADVVEPLAKVAHIFG